MIIAGSVGHLGPCQISVVMRFHKNIEKLLTVNYLGKNSCLSGSYIHLSRLTLVHLFKTKYFKVGKILKK